MGTGQPGRLPAPRRQRIRLNRETAKVRFARPSSVVRPAIVNGAAGVVILVRDRPVTIMGFTVRHGKVVAIDALADPERVARLDLSALDVP